MKERNLKLFMLGTYIYIPFFSSIQKSQAFISLIQRGGGAGGEEGCYVAIVVAIMKSPPPSKKSIRT